MDVKKKAFIKTFLGSLFAYGLADSNYVLQTLSVYVVSKAYWSQGNVNIQWATLLPVIYISIFFVTYPISPVLQKNFGNMKTLIFGGITWLIASILIMCFDNIVIAILCYAVFAFSYAVIYTILLKNCCLYYLNKKGTIISTFEAVATVFSIIFDLFGEFIINPEGETLDTDKGENGEIEDEGEFYSRSVCDNLWKYYVMVLASDVIAMIIIFFTFNEYKKEYDDKIPVQQEMMILPKGEDDDKKEDQKEEMRESMPIEENEAEEEEDIEKIDTKSLANKQSIGKLHLADEKKKKKKIDDITYAANVKKAIRSKRNWLIIFLTNASQIVHYICTNASRTLSAIYMTAPGEGRLVQILPIIGEVSYLVGTSLFGLALDKWGYKKIIIAFYIISLFGGVLVSFWFDKTIVFMILGVITGVIDGGGTVIFPFHTLEVFGGTYFLEVNGIQGLINGITSLVTSFVPFIFSFFFKSTKDELYWPYRTTYSICTAISLISFFLVFYDRSTPFDYGVPDQIAVQAKLKEGTAKKQEDKDNSTENKQEDSAKKQE